MRECSEPEPNRNVLTVETRTSCYPALDFTSSFPPPSLYLLHPVLIDLVLAHLNSSSSPCCSPNPLNSHSDPSYLLPSFPPNSYCHSRIFVLDFVHTNNTRGKRYIGPNLGAEDNHEPRFLHASLPLSLITADPAILSSSHPFNDSRVSPGPGD